MSRVRPLADAVRDAVAAGDHLHFASTPSRSNAAIREVARQYAGTFPAFIVSTSGFHSTAHLLPMLGLGRTYLACFFGDNWPAPRPNPLYTRLARAGVDLECWSLLSYVEALRAGAAGQAWAFTRSLGGSDLGADLARRGKLRGTGDETQVKAIRPDVTFVHAPYADEDGNVLFSPPYGEGFHGALGARRGVIATVERIVPRAFARRHPGAIKIPPERLLAVCVEPFGAHPQPLYVTPDFDDPAIPHVGYVDDTDGYARWRAMAADGVVTATDTPPREAARTEAARRERCADRVASPPRRSAEAERLVQFGALAIARRVRAGRLRALLAGIGNAFFAARVAREALARSGLDVPVMVETGLHDLRCGDACHGFLLSHDHAAAAGRLSSVEDILGALTCGADNRTLGVIGAAQVDARGAVNSLRLADGTVLVGSGGANDIASAADEVVVLAGCDRLRLRERVDHVTSPGDRVRVVVTDRCILERDGGGETRWRVGEVLIDDQTGGAAALELIRAACPWELDPSRARFLSSVDLAKGWS